MRKTLNYERLLRRSQERIEKLKIKLANAEAQQDYYRIRIERADREYSLREIRELFE